MAVVVKPNKQGSRVELSVVRVRHRLAAAVDRPGQFDSEVMIEKLIAGREFTVGVLNAEPLPAGEIIVSGEVFDYQSKHQ